MDPIAPNDAHALIEALAGQAFESYVHFPFREVKSSFCHFYKELRPSDFPAAEANLLNAVETEMRMYRVILGRIPARSFYIGGGTPSLINHEGLLRLLGLARRSLDILPGAEIRFEIFPKIYPRHDLAEKLSILRDFGFTDIVIDVESGNDASL